MMTGVDEYINHLDYKQLQEGTLEKYSYLQDYHQEKERSRGQDSAEVGKTAVRGAGGEQGQDSAEVGKTAVRGAGDEQGQDSAQGGKKAVRGAGDQKENADTDVSRGSIEGAAAGRRRKCCSNCSGGENF